MVQDNTGTEKKDKKDHKIIKIAIGFIISFFFLWLVLKEVAWKDLVAYGSRMNLWIFLFAMLLHPLKFYLTAFRWRIFLKPVKDISTANLFPIIAVAFGANVVLPLRAGEAIRVVALKRLEDVRMSTGLSTVVVERLVDMATLLLFLALLGVSIPLAPQLKYVVMLLTYLCLAGAVCIYLALGFRTALLSFIQKYISTRFPKIGSIAEKLLQQFIEGLKAFNSPLDLMKIAALSVVIWLSEALVYGLVAYSLGISFTINQSLFIMVCASLGTLIPSSPGYVGVFEWAVMGASSALALLKPQALAYAFASHLALTLPITLLGFIYFIKLSVFQKQKELLTPLTEPAEVQPEQATIDPEPGENEKVGQEQVEPA